MTDAAVYGHPRADLVEPAPAATQLSPMVEGAASFDGVPLASLARIDVEAPANTLERQYVLAESALRLRLGGSLNAVARKTRAACACGVSWRPWASWCPKRRAAVTGFVAASPAAISTGPRPEGPSWPADRASCRRCRFGRSLGCSVGTGSIAAQPFS